MVSTSRLKTVMAQVWPIRNPSGNTISAFGLGLPLSNRTRVQDVAALEKTLKLIPPGTVVAPNGNGRPTRRS
jgi:hypothetical protein